MLSELTIIILIVSFLSHFRMKNIVMNTIVLIKTPDICFLDILFRVDNKL